LMPLLPFHYWCRLMMTLMPLLMPLRHYAFDAITLMPLLILMPLRHYWFSLRWLFSLFDYFHSPYYAFHIKIIDIAIDDYADISLFVSLPLRYFHILLLFAYFAIDAIISLFH
jgi:hypothetical protein